MTASFMPGGLESENATTDVDMLTGLILHALDGGAE